MSTIPDPVSARLELTWDVATLFPCQGQWSVTEYLNLTEHKHFIGDDFWTGADLVMEVVSAGPKSRRRDLLEKRREYAAAGIAEYWIIDSLSQVISVLELVNSDYIVVGEFHKGETAHSRLLPGFSVAVGDALGIASV